MMPDEFADWLDRNIVRSLYTACIQTAVTMSEADDSKEPLECLQIVSGGIVASLVDKVNADGDDDLSQEIVLRFDTEQEQRDLRHALKRKKGFEDGP